jgi:hypothetical protein
VKKGCLGCGAAGCVGLLLFVAFLMVAGGFSGLGSHGDRPSAVPTFGERPTPSPKHGWVTAARFGQELDLWASPAALCNSIDQGAREVYNAMQEHRDVDYSTTEHLPGHSVVENGMRVSILSHTGTTCGTSHRIGLTYIEVTDRGSKQRGKRGYIVEGSLSHQ